MRVRDLISKLQKLDPDLEVIATDYTLGEGPIDSVEEAEAEDHWSTDVSLPWKKVKVAHLKF